MLPDPSLSPEEIQDLLAYLALLRAEGRPNPVSRP